MYYPITMLCHANGVATDGGLIKIDAITHMRYETAGSNKKGKKYLLYLYIHTHTSLTCIETYYIFHIPIDVIIVK